MPENLETWIITQRFNYRIWIHVLRYCIEGIKTIDCEADTMWKTFRDTNMTRIDKAVSQQWTAVGARQHCVAKTCNSNPTEPTYINCKWPVHHNKFCTLNSLALKTRAATSLNTWCGKRVSGASEFKVQKLICWTGNLQCLCALAVGLLTNKRF